MSDSRTDSLRADLARLGVRRMLLAIHDVSFPSDVDEDVGRGSPTTRAAGRLFTYARDLGFTGIQLGPQGQTARANPSPYDGTIFSRHIGNIAMRSLRPSGVFADLVEEGQIDQLLVDGERARHQHAFDASHLLVAAAYAALERGARPDLRERLARFARAHAAWLVPDGLHAILCQQHAGAGFRAWPDHERDLFLGDDPERAARYNALVAQHARALDVYALGQLLVHEELAALRSRCDLALYGDLQIGYSDADTWQFAELFLPGYLMGAPPSRTNPAGQPWGYPVLDPAQLATGAARALVVARADKAFTEYDSLRIDHPHGLVCPWVYRSDTRDPMEAVRGGARLYESPDFPDHPELARFAIARADQLDRSSPRHADAWVTQLDPEQIDRYALLFDAIFEAAERHGRARADISCEVLSTMPLPLASMLARHGLGRWRVTQKANMDDPRDVYRSENVAREDWVMLGNHDTAPILTVIEHWPSALRDKWARHLSARLRLSNPARLASNGYFATAMLAELFVSRAENVSIFFADLFGYKDAFNLAGVVDDANWTLRLPPDFERVHAERLARGEALDLPLAVEIALAAVSA